MKSKNTDLLLAHHAIAGKRTDADRVTVHLNTFDDYGAVIGGNTKVVTLTADEVADMLNHTAQLIAVLRSPRRSSGDTIQIETEIENAVMACGLLDH